MPTIFHQEWERNLPSILSFFKQVHSSVCGIVKKGGKPVKGAKIQVIFKFLKITTEQKVFINKMFPHHQP